MTKIGLRSAPALVLAGLGTLVLAADAPARPPGIYLKNGETLVRVPASIPQTRQTGMLKVMLSSGLAKGDVIATLNGARADTRTPRSASFRFQLGSPGDQMQNGLASMMNGDIMPTQAKSGDDFVLVRFEAKGDSREAQVATYGGHSGKTGRGTKNAVAFTTETVGPHVFQVTPREPLPPGEYGFYFASSQGFNGQIWDFGVD